ncbi:MAG: hypothetical protein ACC682_15540 [Gemmatimonadota bacterium]
MPNVAVSHLLRLQSDDGGFGAYPGAESRTESTALAALALLRASETDVAEAAAAALGWLESSQLASGAWPLAPGFREASWSTSLAVLALSYEGDPGVIEAGARWLIDEEGRGATWWVRLLFKLFPARKTVDLDTDLVGWPWASGTFSWVEPTSYAMVALKRLRGVMGSPGRLEARLADADLLLADRACVGGGWNYGNKRVFEEDLWPYPDTTAVALLALADRGDLPSVSEALDVLPGMLADNQSMLALSLGSLALAAHRRDAAQPRAWLSDRLATGETGEIRALAWAALALAENDDVLGLSGG